MHFSGAALTQLIATYGYWAVFIFVFIESMGVPFPGETMLIVASLYAGSTHQLNIVWVIAAAAAGAILGDNTGYAIGRFGGYRLLRRYGHYVHLNERELKLGQYLFMRHGGKVVFFGRFVSILRAWAAFLAGVDRMAWWRFFAFNAAGGILWATLYGVGAYVLGDNINRVARPVAIGIGAVASVIIIGFLFYVHRNFSRLADEAERELPGPLQEHPRQLRDGNEPPLEKREDALSARRDNGGHVHSDAHADSERSSGGDDGTGSADTDTRKI